MTQTNNSKPSLLPCPFCGATPEIFETSDYGYLDCFDVRCNTDDCYLQFGADWHVSTGKAISLWNNRKADNVDK